MHAKSKKKITSALHIIQNEVALETNKTERIKALVREYLIPHTAHVSTRIKKRREEIEAELHRFASH